MLSEYLRVIELQRTLDGEAVFCVRCSLEKGCRAWHHRRYHEPRA